MRYNSMVLRATMGIAAFSLIFTAGCATTTHKSIRVYEYNEEPPARVIRGDPTSEYRMQSPGEMVSPGKMVSPGEMVPPGQTDDDER